MTRHQKYVLAQKLEESDELKAVVMNRSELADRLERNPELFEWFARNHRQCEHISIWVQMLQHSAIQVFDHTGFAPLDKLLANPETRAIAMKEMLRCD